MTLQKMDFATLAGKRVIIRVDWNVSFSSEGKVLDTTRIEKTIPTIKRVISSHQAQQVVLISHLGKAEEKKSLLPVIPVAEKLLGQPIRLFDRLENVPSNPVVMLENVRLFLGEDANTPEFAQELAALGDVYIDEAFGEAHRETASIVGIPRLIPGYAGLQFAREVETILRVRDTAASPAVLIMGGAKVEDKIALLSVMSYRVDVILLGGKLANEFVARRMHLDGPARIITPVDGVGEPYFDIGPETQKLFAAEIAKARTVIWNGPMGKVEEEGYRAGTESIYAALTTNEGAFTLVGGGDTLAAITHEKHKDRIDFVSTGGGAMLALLQKGMLPGIEVLESSL